MSRLALLIIMLGAMMNVSSLSSFRRTLTSLRSLYSSRARGAALSLRVSWSEDNADVNSIDHLHVAETKISDYFLSKLRKVDRLTSIKAIMDLTPENELGYQKAGKTVWSDKESMISYAISAKQKHPDKIILVRIGDFYETYGVDAIMLNNFAGLNLMKSDLKAGCPWRNVQQTLDSLTDAGFSIVIHEEMGEVDAAPGPTAKTRPRKYRAQSFIVTPGRRTYPWALNLRRDLEEFPSDRPYIGIQGTSSSGYNVVLVYLDEKRIAPYSRLNEEAVRTILDSAGAVEPVYLQDAVSLKEIISDTNSVVSLSDYSDKDFSDVVLRLICNNNGIEELTMKTFKHIPESNIGRPRSIYASTAYQIGLKPNPNVPDLIQTLLPKVHKAHSARFLREWLSNPPPITIARHMQSLNAILMEEDVAIPDNSPFIIRKVLTLLDSKQCNANIFRDIKQCAIGTHQMLAKANGHNGGSNINVEEAERAQMLTGDMSSAAMKKVVHHLLALISFRSGEIHIDSHDLQHKSSEVIDIISRCVLTEDEEDHATCHSVAGNSTTTTTTTTTSEKTLSLFRQLSPNNQEVLLDFFAANENEFRGHIRVDHDNIKGIYAEIDTAAGDLIAQILKDFPLQVNESDERENKESRLVHRNGMVYLAKKPSQESSREEVKYVAPYDPKKQKQVGGFTSSDVAAKVGCYRDSVEQAPKYVEKALQELCETLEPYQMIVVLISNWAMILQAVHAHVTAAKQRQWSMPTLLERSGDDTDGSNGSGKKEVMTMDVKDLSAWWMDRRDPATKLNDVQLQGIFLLTAPNMGGKSTIMRSLLVTALLANSGLCVPCTEASIPTYDSFFLRTSSYDIPTEGKSAFALEMDDMRVLLRDSTHKSLVMIDELGRGTSSKDGSALAGSILEALDKIQSTGIFATHLHELLQLPLETNSIRYKKMKSTANTTTGEITWDYLMEDGVCDDSMALETAKEFRIEAGIIERAKELQDQFDLLCRREKTALDSSRDIDAGTTISAASAADISATVTKETEKKKLVLEYVDLAADAVGDLQEKHGAITSEIEELEQKLLNHTMVKEEDQLSEPSVTATTTSSSTNTETDTSLETLFSGISSYIGTRTGMTLFEHNESPAASFEGHSCLYLLEMRNKASSAPVFYVGQTDAIGTRIQQHRSRTFKEYGLIRTAVVRVPNTGAARLIESKIINSLKRKGVVIMNSTDGKNVQFGSSSM